ncbi:unnamed protein product [Haemonchus placei]|uniref:Reverse transcriptase domain-containing protein n=1 Tax=Haemonchus placei TaxID=6290 RepID=A0A0N4WSW4_HAEPC|nr:unnamed protein product [Haemonchus placei]
MRVDQINKEDVKAVIQVVTVQLKMREQRLRWYGYEMRRPPNHPIREAMEFEAHWKRPRGALKKRWRNAIKTDFAEAKVTAEDAVDRRKWRRLARMADPATARDQRKEKEEEFKCLFWQEFCTIISKYH